MTQSLPLTQGLAALVDDADYERASAHKWCAHKCAGKFYARHSYTDQFGVPRTISLHTFLTGWRLVDHANGDGLDNRRENLRAANPSQNAANRRSRNPTGYRGVTFYKRTGRWRAGIGGGLTLTHLGYFATAEEAARAYDAAAIARFGEFAVLNFPQEIPA